LSDYEENKNNSYTQYLPIIRVIKKIIETNQFDGATVGIFNQNIIARKLGLVEKTDNKISGEGITINTIITDNVRGDKNKE
jgi:hypothetical protein